MLGTRQRKAVKDYISDRSVQISETGCMLWLRSDGSHGYPQGSMSGVTGERVSLAHRLSYLSRFGEIPEGYDIDHLCRVKCCVNPLHLEAVTPFANRRRQFGYEADGDLEDTSACPKGHSGYQRDAQGKLFCKTCKATEQKSRRHRTT